MEHYSVGEKCLIARWTFEAPIPYRIELSKKIIEKFSKGPFNKDETKQILEFCQAYYIKRFEEICNQEQSYQFYFEVANLHEMVTVLRHSEDNIELPEGLDKAYISEYRRVLKLIIEQGTQIPMITGEKRNVDFIIRIRPILNDLLYLGTKMYSCANHLAEEIMVEDAVKICFDKENLYYIDRNYHYNFMFDRLSEELEGLENNNFIIDPSGSEDFKKAIQENLKVDYDRVQQMVVILYEKFKAEIEGIITVEKNGFLKDLSNHCEVEPEILNTFMSGLILDKENKLPISTILFKPNFLNRSLNRPFVEWSVNGKPFYLIGFTSLYEAENSLHLNAIPWGKLPDEWTKSKGMVAYSDRKQDEHDKWLDDKIEEAIISLDYKFDRNVEKLVPKNKSFVFSKNGAGEIDFLIIAPNQKKVYVAECKHLLGRYDMPNYTQDYYHFTDPDQKKSYNAKLTKKVQLITENRHLLEEHFKRKYKDELLDISDYLIEGIFFINSPTFYMWNSDIRIFTYEKVVDVLSGRHKDKQYEILMDDEYYFIKHPYFRKPVQFDFDFDDDGEVDKYGDPISI